MLSVALTACTSDKDEPQVPDVPVIEETTEMSTETNPIRLEASMLQTRDDMSDFSCRFFAESLRRNVMKGNDCLSPYSLFAALSMVANGDDADASRELIDLLGSDDLKQLNEYNKLLLSELRNVDSATKLMIANSIWVNSGSLCHPMFQSTLSDTYQATFRSMNLASNESVEAINAWAAENTAGLVPYFLQQPLGVQLAVLNALYFKAPWATQFDKSLTTEADFHNADGTLAKVEMMHHPALEAHFAELNGANVLRLPYANGLFCMTLILPTEGCGESEVASLMTPEVLTAAGNEVLANLYMPRFEMQANGSILNVLKRMGLNVGLPFRTMLAGGDVVIDNILQATRLKVDENGTEAAAVTAVTMDGMADPSSEPRRISMTLDRPFLFAITERSSGAVLFMGRVSAF